MVSEKKIKEVEELKKLVEKYPVIGIVDMFKMPSKQLQEIRKSLRGKAIIRMSKKSLIELALKGVSKPNIEKLLKLEAKQPALILSELDPFKLFKILKKSRSKSYAKAGDIAPEDIIVRAGPTPLPAGPAIGELQRVRIPAMVKEGKIHVKEDTVVAKKGDVINEELANVLKKLEIQPIEISLSLLGAWEKGIVFSKEVLDVDEKEYFNMLIQAHSSALNLAVNTCYPNKISIKILLQKAYNYAKNLGLNAKILEKGTIEDLLMKGSVHAQILKNMIKL